MKHGVGLNANDLSWSQLLCTIAIAENLRCKQGVAIRVWKRVADSDHGCPGTNVPLGKTKRLTITSSGYASHALRQLEQSNIQRLSYCQDPFYRYTRFIWYRLMLM